MVPEQHPVLQTSHDGLEKFAMDFAINLASVNKGGMAQMQDDPND